MIALNETDVTAAEVPFFWPLRSNVANAGLTGYDFTNNATTGDVQILLPGGGGVWVKPPASQIVEKANGRYAVRLTPAQCTVAGRVYIQAIDAGAQAQPYRGDEEIGTGAGDIPVGGDDTVTFFLPDATNPVFNPGLTGHTFVPGEVQICAPGGNTYANVSNADVTEVGLGLYSLRLGSYTGQRGKLYYYVSVSGSQRSEGFVTVLSSSGASGSLPILVNPQPANGATVPGDRVTARYTALSFNVQNTNGTPVSAATTPWSLWIKFVNDDRGHLVYDSATGFMPPYANRSTWKASTALMSLLPDGGWQDTIQQLCIGGASDAILVGTRNGAAGSDPPPNA